jgi:hypothetical protein
LTVKRGAYSCPLRSRLPVVSRLSYSDNRDIPLRSRLPQPAHHPDGVSSGRCLFTQHERGVLRMWVPLHPASSPSTRRQARQPAAPRRARRPLRGPGCGPSAAGCPPRPSAAPYHGPGGAAIVEPPPSGAATRRRPAHMVYDCWWTRVVNLIPSPSSATGSRYPPPPSTAPLCARCLSTARAARSRSHARCSGAMGRSWSDPSISTAAPGRPASSSAAAAST